jgi:prolyl oligopeptidase PreP (S9A serine peptidase family)
MRIDDNLLAITNTIFKNKSDWKWITDEQKEAYFFIINRMMSKKYPTKAQLFNIKNIDKVSSMNLWYQFMLDKPYPKWFWSKSKKENSSISEKDFKLLISKLKIKDLDLHYLIEKHFDFIKEELNYYKSLEKQ